MQRQLTTARVVAEIKHAWAIIRIKTVTYRLLKRGAGVAALLSADEANADVGVRRNLTVGGVNCTGDCQE